MPDTSPGVPAPGARTSREASAQAAAADSASAGTPAPSAGSAPPPVRTTITVPDSVSMVALLGSADELLRLVEAEVDADVHVRGNEIAVTGQPADNAFAVRIFDELIALLGTAPGAAAGLGPPGHRDAAAAAGPSGRPTCSASTSSAAAAARSGPRR